MTNHLRRCKVLTKEDLDPFIAFSAHGQLHLIPKDKIRDLLDEPRKPKKKCNPIDDIGQTIKEDISIEKILKGGIR